LFVDVDLVLHSHIGRLVLLGLLVEDAGIFGRLGFDAAEVIVVYGRGEFHSADVEFSFGGDDISLVDATQRTSVDFVGSSDQEESGFELFEDDDALPAMSASQEDHHSARRDGLAQFGAVPSGLLLPRVDGAPVLLLVATTTEILGWVKARSLFGHNFACLSVLLSLDLLLHGVGSTRLLGLGLLADFLDLPDATLLVHG